MGTTSRTAYAIQEQVEQKIVVVQIQVLLSKLLLQWGCHKFALSCGFHKETKQSNEQNENFQPVYHDFSGPCGISHWSSNGIIGWRCQSWWRGNSSISSWSSSSSSSSSPFSCQVLPGWLYTMQQSLQKSKYVVSKAPMMWPAAISQLN